MKPGTYMTEEEALAEDIERLDREEPGWDRRAKVAEAEAVSGAGMSFNVIAAIYGEDVAREVSMKVKLKKDVRSDFLGITFPAGTEAVVVERSLGNDGKACIVEFQVPDESLVGGARYDTATVGKDDVEPVR